MAAAYTSNPFVRLWHVYTASLSARPIRTKMATSGLMYVIADSIAQLGIEKRSLPWSRGEEEGELSEVERKDGKRRREEWDPVRTARLVFYGGVLFAPIAHHYLNTIIKIQYPSKIRTLGSRMFVDAFIWGPFVSALFPTSLGFLEGKSPSEVKKKVELAWWPAWSRAVMVFTPTQLINYLFVPHHHRVMVLQSVGLCWNVYLSWLNQNTNRRMTELASEQKIGVPVFSDVRGTLAQAER